MAKLASFVFLVGVIAADANGGKAEVEWYHSLKAKAYDAVMSDADVATLSDVTTGGKALKAENCGNAQDLLQADAVHFDTDKWTLSVKGRLLQELSGGNVSAEVRLGHSLAGTSLREKLKRTMVFAASGYHTHTEPLCGHLARGFAKHGLPSFACPMKPGDHTLHFSFDRLPQALVAGQYQVEVRAFDSNGNRVTCLNGGIEVARGKQGQLFRRLGATASAGATAPVMVAASAQGRKAALAIFATAIAAVIS